MILFSITTLIIVVTIIVSIMALKDSAYSYRFDFSPYQIENRKEWYRFFTHAFIHVDQFHLIMNMLALFLLGYMAEQGFLAYLGTVKGTFYYLLLYVGGTVFSTLTTFKKHRHNPGYRSVGASGAVSAVVFAAIAFSPGTDLCLYGIPFLCFPGIVWGIVYLVYSHYQSKKAKDNINHDAHFGGAIFGILFTFLSIPESFPSFISQIGRILSF